MHIYNKLVFSMHYGYTYRQLTPEEQKLWERKLTQYALIITATGTALLDIDKLVRKELKGVPLAVLDSLIRAMYVALQNCHGLLNEAMTRVKAGKMPDFNSDIPFPKPPPKLPENSNDIPSWFMLNWDLVEQVIALVATRNSKLAKMLPMIEAGGRELVKELQNYFPPDHLNKLPTSGSFPHFPTDQLGTR